VKSNTGKLNSSATIGRTSRRLSRLCMQHYFCGAERLDHQEEVDLGSDMISKSSDAEDDVVAVN